MDKNFNPLRFIRELRALDWDHLTAAEREIEHRRDVRLQRLEKAAFIAGVVAFLIVLVVPWVVGVFVLGRSVFQ